jgi:hypothetical protein
MSPVLALFVQSQVTPFVFFAAAAMAGIIPSDFHARGIWLGPSQELRAYPGSCAIADRPFPYFRTSQSMMAFCV